MFAALRKPFDDCCEQLSARFNPLKNRDKGAVLLFAWLLALFVLGLGLRTLGRTVDQLSSVSAQKKAQTFWFDNEASIHARFDALMARLDSGRTFDRDRLVGKVDALCRGLPGVSYDLETPRSQDADAFIEHSVRVGFKNIDLSTLIRFNDMLAGEAPYLGLESISIVPEKAGFDKLRAQCTVSSFELNRG